MLQTQCASRLLFALATLFLLQASQISALTSSAETTPNSSSKALNGEVGMLVIFAVVIGLSVLVIAIIAVVTRKLHARRKKKPSGHVVSDGRPSYDYGDKYVRDSDDLSTVSGRSTIVTFDTDCTRAGHNHNQQL